MNTRIYDFFASRVGGKAVSHGKEHLSDEPTLFFANHTGTYDAAFIHRALWNSGRRGRPYTICKEDAYLEQQFGKVKRAVFFVLANKCGALPIERKYNTGRKAALFQYMKVDTSAQILTFPMGRVSVTGEIFYTTDDIASLEQKEIQFLLSRNKELAVQPVYLFSDPESNSVHVHFGERTRDVSSEYFVDLLSPLTVLTPRHISLVNQGRVSLDKAVTEVAKKYLVVDTHSFETGVCIKKLADQYVDVLDNSFLLNQVKHIRGDLDGILDSLVSSSSSSSYTD